MDEEPLRARAAELIADAGRRTPDEDERLSTALRRWCWPGGGTDHTHPVARTWVRRWGPRPIQSIELRCTCEAGRCPLCN